MAGPCAGTLIEIWQANAAGRYVHKTDQHEGAARSELSFGAGRCVTNDDGGYRFYTIKPGAYPWGNHFNAWRPRSHPPLAIREHGSPPDW